MNQSIRQTRSCPEKHVQTNEEQSQPSRSGQPTKEGNEASNHGEVKEKKRSTCSKRPSLGCTRHSLVRGQTKLAKTVRTRRSSVVS